MAEQAQGSQPGASHSDAPTGSRAGCVFEVCLIGTHAVLWCPDEQTIFERIPICALQGMVEGVKASEPETQSDLETHGTADCGMVPIGAYLSSLSSGTRTRLT